MSIRTPAERQASRVAREAREDRDYEECGRCGFSHAYICHETDREHAPEGLAYFVDVPFCDFLPTGHRSHR